MKIRVMIVDDHKIVRQGLVALIRGEPSMVLVAEADNGRQAIELARQHKPDVITMDIGMPDMNGIEATRLILQENPSIKIVALSIHADRKYLFEIFKAGASAYLAKDCVFSELVQAVKSAHAGERYVGKDSINTVVEGIICARAKPSPLASLSDREVDVLKKMAMGLNAKHIAYQEHLSIKTVESYQSRIKKKLGMTNLVQLTKLAICEGLVGSTPDADQKG